MSSEKQVLEDEDENEFTTTHHVYLPHKAGLPPLGDYFREVWRRREFATEMSRSGMRAANTLTVFGQFWLVLSPLLLAGVYFLLVQVLSGGGKDMAYFAQLTSGLFIYYFVAGSMASGAASVVGAGKLLLNTAFPRFLMPLSAVRTSFYRFLPTLPIYFAFHLIAGLGFEPAMLLAPFFLVLLILFSVGLAGLFATMQVYFRDTTSFLPYINRLWLYASPVLWSIEEVPRNFKKVLQVVEYANPLHSLIGGFNQCLVNGDVPSLNTWVTATVWALVMFTFGTLYFMTREREFAVRI